VVGAGISGLAAAYLLGRVHDVTLFEGDARLGGHAHTHEIGDQGVTRPLDSGFIVYNPRTYPRFLALLDELGLHGRRSDMSFGVRCRRCGLEYSSRGAGGLFAQPQRLLSPTHLRLLADIPRFNRNARAFLAGADGETTLGEFVDAGRYSAGFRQHFILPMGGAIWSSSIGDLRAFSARSFLTFFANHGWLSVEGAPA
jgi:predicted NAD/FAD-binding protein